MVRFLSCFHYLPLKMTEMPFQTFKVLFISPPSLDPQAVTSAGEYLALPQLLSILKESKSTKETSVTYLRHVNLSNNIIASVYLISHQLI